MLTIDALHAICPKANAPVWSPALEDACGEFDISTPQRLAAFLAQVAHESNGLTVFSENLNYSVDGLLKVFGKYFTPTLALSYAREPERIANRVYAMRLGNGDEGTGDGWRYRGRGPIQLTGRENYRKAGTALGADLEANPDSVVAPLVGSRVAAWFWNQRKLNPLADAGDFLQITKRINGGTNGLADREAYWAKAKQALGA